MLLIEVQQGSPQWAAHRATHLNASEAAAMLGVCPYKTREQLLHEKKTGIIPPVDRYTQRRFDHGHQCEKWARNVTEYAIGEDLFPCVGVLENSRLSASFDGLTLDRSLVWEHKLLSKSLRETIESGYDLPLHYRVQLEQQLLVSGATKAMFMASYWNEDGALIEKYTREYVPDCELRQRIILGWQQFENDLADYVVKPVAKTNEETDALPVLSALYCEPSGPLSFSTNLDHFKQHALTVLDAINRDLVSESDFAHAETAIKWCKTGEDQLTHAQAKLIEDMPDLNNILSTIKTIQNQMRDIRLDLDKQVKTEKARVKQSLIAHALMDIEEHYQNAHIEYGEDAPIIARMESAIKGLKNLDKMQNAIDRVVVAEKTAFTQRLESGELTRLISVEEINAAIAPLSISAEGLKQCGFVLAFTRVADFPRLIQQLRLHLTTAKLPEPLAKTA